jgi:amino-acid N-acetyltransferase
LSECGLPVEDLTEKHLEHFYACGPRTQPDGVVGLEIYGPVALLRSLAVAERVRGHGHGKHLVATAERRAKERGVRDIYLLTTSAKDLFEALGYREVPRETAPQAIRDTTEFSSLCPATATFMQKSVVG